MEEWELRSGVYFVVTAWTEPKGPMVAKCVAKRTPIRGRRDARFQIGDMIREGVSISRILRKATDEEIASGEVRDG